MGRQLFQDGPYVDTMVSTPTALVATTEQAAWDPQTFTPIFANDPKAGKIYCVRAGGIITTAASGTLILNPRIGLTISGATLGVSQTVTMPVSMTNVAWYFQFDIVFRVIGLGATSSAVGTGFFATAPFASAPAVGISCVIPLGGGTAATTLDITTAIQAFCLGKTLSVAGSWSTQYAYIFSRN